MSGKKPSPPKEVAVDDDGSIHDLEPDDDDDLEIDDDEVEELEDVEVDYEAEDEEEEGSDILDDEEPEEKFQEEEEVELPLIECECEDPCECDICEVEESTSQLELGKSTEEIDIDEVQDGASVTAKSSKKKGEDDDTDDNYDFFYDYGDDPTQAVVQETVDKSVGDKVVIEETIEEEAEFIDTLTEIEGVIGITLSDATKHYFGIEDLTADSSPKYTWLNWKKIKLHMFTFDEKSEFTPHYDKIKFYPDLAMLLGIDTTKQTGHNYYLCLTIEARNRLLNPPKKVKELAQKEEEKVHEMAIIMPRKWKGFLSELEVDQENVVPSRPLITLTVHRLKTLFGNECNFQNAPSDNPNLCASFKSEDPTERPFIHKMEIDCGIQVKGETSSSFSQTGPVFKRNQIIEPTIQTIPEEEVDALMQSESLANFFRKALPRLEKSLEQNGMVDILNDEYNEEEAEESDEEEEENEEEELQQV